MSAENEQQQPSEMERLISVLKDCLQDEPSETQLAELGESLLEAVKSALSGTH